MNKKLTVYITDRKTSATRIDVGSGHEIAFKSVSAGFIIIEGCGRIDTLIIERTAVALLDSRWWQAINAHADRIIIV